MIVLDILEHIKNKRLFFDGAMGTMLQKAVLEQGENFDLLSLSNPELVQSIHRAYVEAGSQCVSTNTFGVSRLNLTDAEISKLVFAAVENARAAKPMYVALDVGPIGNSQGRQGNKAYDIFKKQVIAGGKAKADVILFETFYDLLELKTAVKAAKENTDLPVFAAMTYQTNGKTLGGDSVIDVTMALNDLGVDAFGANCSFGPKELLNVAKEMVECAAVPVIMQPNAGLPDSFGDYKCGCGDFAEYMVQMAEMGVQILGGCCGTTPEYIARMVKRVG